MRMFILSLILFLIFVYAFYYGFKLYDAYKRNEENKMAMKTKKSKGKKKGC
jgi:CHASE3 domain sensor protein